jgi:hypothetical protein
MFDEISLNFYRNPLVDRNSSLFSPRRFASDSKLLIFLLTYFPQIFNDTIPLWNDYPCITLYVVMQIIFKILEIEKKKDFEVICLDYNLFNVFEVQFCTKPELKNLIKSQLEPVEHFELELFDPTEHCQIPHRYEVEKVWSIKFMSKFPNNRRALTTFLLSKELYTSSSLLHYTIQNYERRFNPGFTLEPCTALQYLLLTLKLIKSDPDNHLDFYNIQVLKPPLTWQFVTPRLNPDYQPKASYLHISNFPSQLLELLSVYRS